MSRNLYFKELKFNRKSLLIWSSIVVGLTVLIMCLFPYMKDINEDLVEVMKSLPEGMVKAMGIDEKSFSSILGMYNSYYGIYIIVLLSIYSASTGATIISKEERNRTAEFLLTKPISRRTVFNTKVLALLTLALVAFFVQTLTAGVFTFAFEDQVNWSVFTTMHTHGLILILFFTCIGLFLSMLINPKSNFMGLAVGVVFGSYFISTIAKAVDAANWIGYLSPFHYLSFSVSDPDYNIDLMAVGVFIFLGVLLVVASCRIYEGKDISA